MKKYYILFCILTMVGCASQKQGNDTISSMWVGTWTNATKTDTIIITSECITWTSKDNGVFVSYIDCILHNDTSNFSFNAYPTVYVLSLEKTAAAKIIFSVQTVEGYHVKSDVYSKQPTKPKKS